ncbi:hypothetical protein EPYR_02894 [Erwinia pyrifoliae DSM 12163]|nr:hypothetical protein EPYR_02894 [Erwinia pyrifoliae DSM 12163]
MAATTWGAATEREDSVAQPVRSDELNTVKATRYLDFISFSCVFFIFNRQTEIANQDSAHKINSVEKSVI